MIKIEDLSVAFGETEAVRYVNLDLVEGEILGVVGNPAPASPSRP